MKTTSEIKVLPPRRVPLAVVQEREAAALLVELLLDAARERRGLRSSGALAGAFRWRHRQRHSVAGEARKGA
jgi:hypothetical protein